MNRLCAMALLALLPLAAGGCVAAAIPVAAGGMIARDQIGLGKKQRTGKRREAPKAPGELATPQARAAAQAVEGRAVLQPQLGALPPPDGVVPPPIAASGVLAPRAGAGEDAAHTLQSYQALWTHVAAQAARRRRGEPVQSVVLAQGATLEAPRYVPCGAKPLAVVFDLDENPDRAADPDARWRRWKGDGTDLVVPTPGAIEGIEAARREGLTVIFTSARSPEGAPGAIAMLERLGFGTLEPGRTLFMRGDATAGDAGRQAIAAGHCVVALVGDSLGDFSNLFNAAGNPGRRQTAATETMIASLWGAGWFLLPNPVHSTAVPTK